MFELLIAGGIAGLLFGGAAVAFLVPWTALLAVGLMLIVGGLVVGVPTGFWYHVKLRRALAPRGELPARWWVSPIRLHDRLRREERLGVLVWCYLGGLGFFLILAGSALAALASLRSR